MRKVLFAGIAAVGVASSAAADQPKHCAPDAVAWWSQYGSRVNAHDGLPDVRSLSPGVMAVRITWASSGVEQVLLLGEIEGRFCSFSRRTLSHGQQASAE